ncbi:MAG: hypothetical protein ACR2NM_07480 [Bythopirellula sp.]
MITIVLLSVHTDLALAVEATFVLDEQQSSLTIDASTVFVFPLNDSDTQPLTGTIETTLDFGTSGTLPEAGEITVNSAAISSVADFSLTLGLPPLLGVNVDISGAVADITTPNPPALLTGLPTGLVRYQFDAAAFDITLNQGVVSVTGTVNQTSDLSATPVSGTAAPNTFGQITFLDIATNGPLTEIDALMELPILFTEVVDFDGQVVTLDVSGEIVATSSFAVALARPADLNSDGDIDGQDLLQIQQHDPALISAWEIGYPEAPAFAAARAVPEPSALLITLLMLSCAAARRSL